MAKANALVEVKPKDLWFPLVFSSPRIELSMLELNVSVW